MIFVTSGHEKGIGLEIFLKSFENISTKDQKDFILHVHENTLKTNLEILNKKYKISNNILFWGDHQLKIVPCSNLPTETTNSLNSCLNVISKKDILITLPSSKDQILFDKKTCSGHTDFFRKFFKKEDISMNFLSPHSRILLITDHIPLREVPLLINEERIYQKVSETLSGLANFFSAPQKVLLAGINPHAGESGLLGNEDLEVSKAITRLQIKFPNISFLGPLPGDTMHRHENAETLSVYMYHDQGLVRFKAQNGLIGINISLGLPFLRLSVDHGTAFDLYGKGIANKSGQSYLNSVALNLHRKIYEKK